MSNPEHENSTASHDELVRDYLSTQLDAQAGRAEARFHAFLMEQQVAPHQRHPNVLHLPPRVYNWTLGIVGAALAASLAAIWAVPSLQPMAPANISPIPVPGSSFVNNPAVVERDVQSQTFDDGTYVIDGNNPVRVMRRRDIERTRWFDQNRQLQSEQVVPRDHVVYVHVKTY